MSAELHSLWVAHGPHLVLLAAWIVAFAAVVVHGRLRKRRAAVRALVPSEQARLNTLLRRCGAASILAGGIHLAVVGPHFAVSTAHGSFALGLALSQVGWGAVIIVRPDRGTALVGLAGTAALSVIWVVTEASCCCSGCAGGVSRTVADIDALATIAELTVLAVGASALGWRQRLSDGITALTQARSLGRLTTSPSVPISTSSSNELS
jgi:hypothetical protein